MLKGEMTDQEYVEFLDARKKKASLGMIGEPEDIAAAVLFFASDESRNSLKSQNHESFAPNS
jgi:NAD(P)-dependent dehydrogenase (short-subunit alcohol dehydrogenase family)